MGFPWLHLLVPLFWLVVVVVAFVLFLRARRRGYAAPWASGVSGAGRGPSAEQILAERFARGEVDEVDYRARLEVLRGSSPS